MKFNEDIKMENKDKNRLIFHNNYAYKLIILIAHPIGGAERLGPGR